MKKFARLTAVLIVLLAFSGLAAAAGPEPTAFSTTGYTTNLAPNLFPPEWGLPPLIPSEFEFLPNGYIKFHIRTQGEPGDGNDVFCRAVYGAPCQQVCSAPPPHGAGKPCGTDGYFPNGSFTFDEWGLVVDPNLTTYAGYNHGRMSIATDAGQAEVRFGGSATLFSVTGGFAFLDGTKEYNKLKGKGVYGGGAGYVFTVNYAPCGGEGQPACPACAVFGDELKIKKDKIEWEITNDGEEDLTISRVMVFWPVDGEGLGEGLKEVKLGGKKIYTESTPAPLADITAGWEGKDKDRSIDSGKKEKLELKFDQHDISANPWDYTILVEFGEGCAVPFVAFAPPSQP